MKTGIGGTLVLLGDGPDPPALGQQDLRGRRVFDRASQEIGNVRDLLIDGDNGQIRLLVIAADFTVDTIRREFALPVDAIDRLEPDRLFIDQMRDRVLGAPLYDPRTPPPAEYWDGLFSYYGYEPFWTPG